MNKPNALKKFVNDHKVALIGTAVAGVTIVGLSLSLNSKSALLSTAVDALIETEEAYVKLANYAVEQGASAIGIFEHAKDSGMTLIAEMA